jgi:Fic family protein
MGLMTKPALYLSDYFDRHKKAYIDHLMAVREGYHLREWLIFFLHGIEVTALDSVSVYKEILSLQKRIEAEVLSNYRGQKLENARALIRNLCGQPIIDIKGSTNIIKGTSNTATFLIKDFITHSLLRESTGRQRNQRFTFQPNLDLFQK